MYRFINSLTKCLVITVFWMPVYGSNKVLKAAQVVLTLAYPAYKAKDDVLGMYRRRYSNSTKNYFETLPDLPTDSSEYKRVAEVVPTMSFNNNPIYIKINNKLPRSMGCVNLGRAYYVMINPARAEEDQEWVSRQYPESNRGLTSFSLLHELSHAKHDDGSDIKIFMRDGVVPGIGIAACLTLGLGTRASIITSIFSVLAEYHVYLFSGLWAEYSADKQAYAWAHEHESNSAILQCLRNDVIHRAECPTLFDRFMYYHRDPHPEPLVRANLGRSELRKKWGEERLPFDQFHEWVKQLAHPTRKS